MPLIRVIEVVPSPDIVMTDADMALFPILYEDDADMARHIQRSESLTWFMYWTFRDA